MAESFFENEEYYLEKIKEFRLIDDTFLSTVFEDIACAQFKSSVNLYIF